MLRTGFVRAVTTGSKQLRNVSEVAETIHHSALKADVPRASSEAWDFAPREACLAGTRGVLRLAGNGLIHFLQVRTENPAAF